MSVISIYLTNLGKYVEGTLIGEWVNLPVTDEEMKKVLERIGVNKFYEEWFISDYEVALSGLGSSIQEYSDLNKLNELATKIDDLCNWDVEILEAILEIETYSDANAIIELIDNLDDYTLLTEVFADIDLGYYYAVELCDIDSIPERLKNYFDYEAYGRDIRYECIGGYTKQGFLICQH